MKKNIISIICFILFVHSASSQSFINNLGKNINNQIECSCADKDGNLTIGYYNAKDTIKDTLHFIKWNVAAGKWAFINKIPVKNDIKNYSKCIYKNDSLLVFTKVNNLKKANAGLILVSSNNYKILGTFRHEKSDGAIIDLKQTNKGILIFGEFDSIRINSSSTKAQHITLYNGVGFNQIYTPSEFSNNPISNFQVASNQDTFLLITGEGKFVWQYIFPSKWELISKSAKNNFTGVAHNVNNWIISRENSDSIMIYNSKKIEFRLLKQKLTPPLSFLNTNKGLLVSENGKQGRLMKYDPALNYFIPIYQNYRSDTIQRNLVFSKNKIYYTSSTPIIYRNKNYGNVVELNIAQSMPIGYDTISIFVFNDTNNNNKFDNGENLTQFANVFNKTYSKFLTSSSGKFKEIVPDYNDVEYEIKNIQRCLETPFYFKTQFSSNTKNDIKHDSIYFPIQENKVSKNLIVKSYAQKNKARLMDTINLEINIYNNDCNLYKSIINTNIKLDSNTTFISSIPAFTSFANNELNYKLNYSSVENSYKIKLKVLYSNLKYKIGDIVKHKILLYSDFAEDTTDNSDSIVQKLVYSFDPNEKNCEPSGSVSGNIKNIRYFIDFQNEGTDEARRVTVIDTLDMHIPVYEFQMVACSHNYKVYLKDNVVTWVFDNINLPSKQISESTSKGYIIFEAHLNKNLEIGDSVLNKAYIYFDYNTPIITNIASVLRKPDDTDQSEIEGKYSIIVYPNPAAEIITLRNISSNNQTIKVYNMVGQEISIFEINATGIINKSIVDWPRGMYFIKSSKGGFQKFLVH
ncbi:MAG: T9SS type A sorting domain-containing protein [Bacteroidia bacterium]|nr:T9SS type A sorting domain-containing protein [Bacteroidia bacterium]